MYHQVDRHKNVGPAERPSSSIHPSDSSLATARNGYLEKSVTIQQIIWATSPKYPVSFQQFVGSYAIEIDSIFNYSQWFIFYFHQFILLLYEPPSIFNIHNILLREVSQLNYTLGEEPPPVVCFGFTISGFVWCSVILAEIEMGNILFPVHPSHTTQWFTVLCHNPSDTSPSQPDERQASWCPESFPTSLCVLLPFEAWEASFRCSLKGAMIIWSLFPRGSVYPMWAQNKGAAKHGSMEL